LERALASNNAPANEPDNHPHSPLCHSDEVVGASINAFQLPSACFPHTTTYIAFNVFAFPFFSLTVN
jgi:hypothetical protein